MKISCERECEVTLKIKKNEMFLFLTDKSNKKEEKDEASE